MKKISKPELLLMALNTGKNIYDFVSCFEGNTATMYEVVNELEEMAKSDIRANAILRVMDSVSVKMQIEKLDKIIEQSGLMGID